MKGTPLDYQNFTVYPEYCGLSLDYLIVQSRTTNNYVIATVERGYQNMAVVFYKGGMVYARSKYRLHSSEVEKGIKPGSLKPGVVSLDGRNVLILICYEIVFPEDYLGGRERVELVVHMVGQPMFSEEQREGWIALQKALSLVYGCPVICCCGGHRDRMNITGVIDERS